MITRFLSLVALAAGALLAIASPVHAQAPAKAAAEPLTVEDIWKQPRLSGPTLSRDGKYLAATMPLKGRMNLVVMELETRNVLAHGLRHVRRPGRHVGGQ